MTIRERAALIKEWFAPRISLLFQELAIKQPPFTAPAAVPPTTKSLPLPAQPLSRPVKQFVSVTTPPVKIITRDEDSVIAHCAVSKLSKPSSKQLSSTDRIMDTIEQLNGATVHDIKRVLTDVPSSGIRGRVSELVKMGRVKVVGKERVKGRDISVYQITDEVKA